MAGKPWAPRKVHTVLLFRLLMGGVDGAPIAPADAARNRARIVAVDCEHGPVIAIAGRFVHTSIHATVGALLDGAPLNGNTTSGPYVSWQTHLGVPPGARVEFIVKGPPLGVGGLLVTRAVDTGPGGENDPNRALATMHRFLTEFGMTPASRSRVGVVNGASKKSAASKYLG